MAEMEEIDALLGDLAKAAAEYASRGSTSYDMEATVQGISSMVARSDLFAGSGAAGSAADEGSGAADLLRRLCDRLFASPESAPDSDILSFCMSTAQSSVSVKGSGSDGKDVTKARADLHCLTSNLVLVAPAAMVPHLPAVRKACLHCIQRDTASEPARCALLPLQRIMQQGLMSADTFAPREVRTVVTKALHTSNSPFKTQPTPKGPAILTLGMLTGRFPAAFDPATEVLKDYEYIMYTLREEWPQSLTLVAATDGQRSASGAATAAAAMTSSERDRLPVVAGCLQALDELLYPPQHANIFHLAETAKKIEREKHKRAHLYAHIVRALLLGHDREVSRGADASVAAHHLLARHAHHFKDQMVSYANMLFDILHMNLHSKRYRIQIAVQQPFHMLLHLVSDALASNLSVGGMPPREAFNWFLQQRIMNMLQGTSTLATAEDTGGAGAASSLPSAPAPMAEYDQWYDLKHAVKAIGQFAPAIAVHMREGALPDVSRILLERVQDMLTSGVMEAQLARQPQVEQLPDDLGEENAASTSSSSSSSSSAAGAGSAPSPKLKSAGTYNLRIIGKRKVELLSAAVQACACMIQQMPSSLIDDAVIAPVQRAVETLIVDFPELTSYAKGGRNDVCKAVLSLFVALAGSDTDTYRQALLADLTDRLAPSSFLRTLSREPDYESKLVHPLTGQPESRLLFEYIPFWRELIMMADASTRSEMLAMAAAGDAVAKGRRVSVAVGEERSGAAGGDEDEDDALDPTSLQSTLTADAAAASGSSASDPGAVHGRRGGSTAAGAGAGAASSSAAGAGPASHPSPGAVALRRVRNSICDALLQRILSQLTEADLNLVAGARVAKSVVASGAAGSDNSSIILDSQSASLALSMDAGEVLGRSHRDAGSDDADQSDGDLDVGVHPLNSEDFDRFLSCIEFVRYCLPLLDSRSLHRWADQYVRACIRGAAKYTHVSGFYTVIAVVLRSVAASGYFSGISLRQGDANRAAAPWMQPPGGSDDAGEADRDDEDGGEYYDGDGAGDAYSQQADGGGSSAVSGAAGASDGPADDESARYAVYRLVDAFVDETLLRLRQFKGELLLSALQMVLLLPSCFIVSDPVRSINALHTALAAGVSQPALALLGVEALSRFHSSYRDLVKPHLPALLPRVGSILEQGQQRSDADAAAAGISTDDQAPDSKANTISGSGGDAALDEEEEDAGLVVDEDAEDAVRNANLADTLRRPLSESNKKLIRAAQAAAAMAGLGAGSSVAGGAAIKVSSQPFIYSTQLLVQQFTMEGAGGADDGVDDAGIGDVSTAEAVRTGSSQARAFRFLTLADQDISVAGLRYRVVLLLGRLGGDARYVTGCAAERLVDEVEWGSLVGAGGPSGGAPDDDSVAGRIRRLCIKMTVGDVTMDLPMDILLPRVTKLAVSASTRQVKVAACEFLHSALSIIVGCIFTNDQSNPELASHVHSSKGEAPRPSSYIEVFAKLLPICFQLAVDGESIAQQLFAPLSLQIVRLFAGEHMGRMQETQKVVEAVADACTSSDTALRDFGAGCYAELISFRVSQLRKIDQVDKLARDRAVDPYISISSLIQRLVAAAKHSSPHARLGACLAWNHCYTAFLNDATVASAYILLITDHMLTALRLSANDGSALAGTSAAAAAAVDHCLEVIEKHAVALLAPDAANNRSAQAPQTLQAMVAYLFVRCGSLETQGRRKCMLMFDRLAARSMRPTQQTPSAPSHAHAATPAQIVRKGALARVIGTDASYHASTGGSASSAIDPLALTRQWVTEFTTGTGIASSGASEAGISNDTRSASFGSAPSTAAIAGGGDAGDSDGGSMDTSSFPRDVVPGKGQASLVALAEAPLRSFFISPPTIPGGSQAGGQLNLPQPGTASSTTMQEATDRLAASLDIYTWMLRRGYVNASVFANAEPATGAGAGAGSKPKPGNRRKRADSESSLEDASTALSSVDLSAPMLLRVLKHFQDSLFMPPAGTVGPLSTSASSSMLFGDPVLAWLVSDGRSLLPSLAARLQRSRTVLLCRLMTFVETAFSGSLAAPTTSASASSTAQSSSLAPSLTSAGVIGSSLFTVLYASLVSPQWLAVEDEDMASISGASGAGTYLPQSAARLLRTLAASSTSTRSSIVTAIATHIASAVAAGDETADFRTLGSAVLASGASGAAAAVGRSAQVYSAIKRSSAAVKALDAAGLLPSLLEGMRTSAAASVALVGRQKNPTKRAHTKAAAGGSGAAMGMDDAGGSATTPTTVQQLAALYGTAAFRLPVNASPAAIDCAAAVLRLAVRLGWSWASGLSSLLCPDVGSADASSAIAQARTVYNRFNRILSEHLLRADVFVDVRAMAEQGAQSGAGAGDRRLMLRFYSVLQEIIRSLLVSTEASPSAASGKSSAGADAAANIIRLRDHVWRMFTDLLRVMGTAAGGSTAEGIAGALDSANAGAEGEGAEVSAPSADVIGASVSTGGPRIRSSVFVNSLIATLPDLRSWAGPQAPDDVVVALLTIIRSLAAFDPWLLIIGGNAAASSTTASRGQQVRVLPHDAEAVVVALLQRASSTSDTTSPAVTRYGKQTSLRSAAIDLLPVLLPGYASTCLVSGTTVPAHVLGTDRLAAASSSSSSSAGAGGRALNSVYPAALDFVRRIRADFPLSFSELEDPSRTADRANSRAQLSGLLAALTATGSVQLLRLLQPLIREGEAHPMYSDIAGALQALAANIAPDGDSPKIILRECLIACFATAKTASSSGSGRSEMDIDSGSGTAGTSSASQPPVLDSQGVIRFMCESLAVPLLQRMKENVVVELFTSDGFLSSLSSTSAGSAFSLSMMRVPGGGVMGSSRYDQPSFLLQYLMNLVSQDHAIDETGVTVHSLDPIRVTRATCAYQLLACFFEVVKGKDAQAKYNDTRKTQYIAGRTETSNHLSLDIAAACQPILKAPPSSFVNAATSAASSGSAMLLIRFFQAVYGCMISAFIRTQTKLDVLEKFLLPRQLAGKDQPPFNGDFFHRLMDVSESTSGSSSSSSGDAEAAGTGGLPFFKDTGSFPQVSAAVNLSTFSAHTSSPEVQDITDRYRGAAEASRLSHSIGTGLASITASLAMPRRNGAGASGASAGASSLSSIGGFAAAGGGPLTQSYARQSQIASLTAMESDGDAATTSHVQGLRPRYRQPVATAGVSLLAEGTDAAYSASLPSLVHEEPQQQHDMATTTPAPSAGGYRGSVSSRSIVSVHDGGSPNDSAAAAAAADVSYSAGSIVLLGSSSSLSSPGAAASMTGFNGYAVAPTSTDDIKSDLDAFTLQLDVFNRNPVMLHLLRLMDHLGNLEFEAEKAKAPSSGGAEDKPKDKKDKAPSKKTLDYIIDRMKPDHPLPVRLFIVRLVINIVRLDLRRRQLDQQARLIAESSGSVYESKLRPPLFRGDWPQKTAPLMMQTALDLRDLAKKQTADLQAACIGNVGIVFHSLLRDVVELLVVDWRRPEAAGAQSASAGAATGSSSGSASSAVSPSYFIPDASNQALCSEFLTYVIKCSGNTAGERDRWMRIEMFSWLIYSWVPKGVHVSRTQILPMLFTDDNKHSKTFFRGPGTRIQVAFYSLYHSMKLCDEALFDPEIESQQQDWKPHYGEGENAYSVKNIARRVCTFMNHNNKRNPYTIIYDVFAKLAGYTLRQAATWASRKVAEVHADSDTLHKQDVGQQTLDAFMECANNNLRDIWNSCQAQSGQRTQVRGYGPYLNVVYRLSDAQEGYPHIIDDTKFTWALKALVQQKGRSYLRGKNMELVARITVCAARSKQLDNKVLYSRLKPYLVGLLMARVAGRSRGGGVQATTMKLLRTLLDDLSNEDVAELFDPSKAAALSRVFPSHPSNTCRAEFYSFCMRAWERLEAAGAGAGASGAAAAVSADVEMDTDVPAADDQALRAHLRECLLNGLFDSDRTIRSSIYKWWNHPSRLSDSLPQRLQQLMGKLFDPEPKAARPWILHAAPLLLSLAHRDPEFDTRNAIMGTNLGTGGNPQGPTNGNAPVIETLIETDGGVTSGAGSLQPRFADVSSVMATQATLQRRRFGLESMVSGTLAPATFMATQARGASALSQFGRQQGMRAVRTAPGQGIPQALEGFARNPLGVISSFAPVVGGGGGAGGMSQAASLGQSLLFGGLQQQASLGVGSLADSTAYGNRSSSRLVSGGVGRVGPASHAQAARDALTLRPDMFKQKYHNAIVHSQANDYDGDGGAGAWQLKGGRGKTQAATQSLSHDTAGIAQSRGFTGMRRAAGATQIAPSQGGDMADQRPEDTALQARDERRVQQQRQKAEMRSKVRLTRKTVRAGIYPDIQIPKSDFILPLQALCEMDTSIARDTFAQIFEQTYSRFASTSSTAASSSAAGAAAGSRTGAPARAAGAGSGRNVDMQLTGAMTAAQRQRLAASGPQVDENERVRGELIDAVKGMLAALQRKTATLGVSTGSTVAPIVGLLHDILDRALLSDHKASATSKVSVPAFVAEPSMVASTGQATLSYASAVRVLEDSLHAAGEDGTRMHAPVASIASLDADSASSSSSASTGDAERYPLGVLPVFSDTGKADALTVDKAQKSSKVNTHFSLTALGTKPPIAESTSQERYSAWRELQSLYSSIGEEDVVSGLSSFVHQSAHVRHALQHEIHGDFPKAAKSYEVAINEWRQAHPDAVGAEVLDENDEDDDGMCGHGGGGRGHRGSDDDAAMDDDDDGSDGASSVASDPHAPPRDRSRSRSRAAGLDTQGMMLSTQGTRSGSTTKGKGVRGHSGSASIRQPSISASHKQAQHSQQSSAGNTSPDGSGVVELDSLDTNDRGSRAGAATAGRAASMAAVAAAGIAGAASGVDVFEVPETSAEDVRTWEWARLRSIQLQLNWRVAEATAHLLVDPRQPPGSSTDADSISAGASIDQAFPVDAAQASKQPADRRAIVMKELLHRAAVQYDKALALDADDPESHKSALMADVTDEWLRSNSKGVSDMLRIVRSSTAGSHVGSNDAAGVSSSGSGTTGITAPFSGALANILQHRYSEAMTHVKDGLRLVSGIYAALSPLALSTRARTLSTLAPLAELSDFLDIADRVQQAKASGARSAATMSAVDLVRTRALPMLHSMRSRSISGIAPTATESSSLWDDVILARTVAVAETRSAAGHLASLAFGDSDHTSVLQPVQRDISAWSSAVTRATLAHAAIDTREAGARNLARKWGQQLMDLERGKAGNVELYSLASSRILSDLYVATYSARLATADSSDYRSCWLPGDLLREGIEKVEKHQAIITSDGRGDAMTAFRNSIRPALEGLQLAPQASTRAEDAMLAQYLFGRQVLIGEMHARYARYAVREGAAVELQPVAQDVQLASEEMGEPPFTEPPALVARSIETAHALLTASIGIAGAGGNDEMDTDGGSSSSSWLPAGPVLHSSMAPTSSAASSGSIARVTDTIRLFALPLQEQRKHLARIARAKLTYALFCNDMLRHWEDATNGAAGAGAGGDVAIDTLRSRLSMSKDSLAASVVENVLGCLTADPAGGANGVLQSALKQSDLTRSVVMDDCGIDESGTGSASMSSPLTSPAAMLPHVIDLVTQYHSAAMMLRSVMGLTGANSAANNAKRPPLYVFLPWIPQLFAAVQAPPKEGAAGAASSSSSASSGLSSGARDIAALLRLLARAYPQAVYYPYRISTYNDNPLERKPRELLQLTAPIEREFKPSQLKLMNQFVTALEDLHSPDQRYNDWRGIVNQAMSREKKLTGKSKLPDATRQELITYLRQQFGADRRADATGGSGVAARSAGGARGPSASKLTMTQEFWATYGAEIEKDFTSGKWDPAVLKKIREAKREQPKTLRSMSLFLADFNASNYAPSETIEVPGQYDSYDGRAPPDPAAHATIDSIDPKLLTMTSLKQPKRITFIGRDERSYRFLAKGGEDMRVDNRVEQMFRTVNAALDSDASAAKRDLRIRTYSVVPMTPLIGLIEWVDNTAPLKGLIEDEGNRRIAADPAARPVLTKNARTGHEEKWTLTGNNFAMSTRQGWLDQFRNVAVNEGRMQPGAIGPDYWETFRVKTEDEWARKNGPQGEAKWREVMQHMPVDMIRATLQRMVPSAEGYLAVRSRFLRSYASFNIAGYVLGVGDRHLDNFLLNKSDGSIVPIDFGCVFGQGSALLVPELIPFRLTPNLLCVAAPLPTPSLLHSLMTAAMRALGQDAARRAILSILDVFVKEPTLDWVMKSAKREKEQQKAQRKDAAASSPDGSPRTSSSDPASDGGDGGDELMGGNWYPRAKVVIADLKLRRANPAPLMMLDVRSNQHVFPASGGIPDLWRRIDAGETRLGLAGTDKQQKETMIAIERARGIKAAVYGAHRPSHHPRARPENSAPMQMSVAERSLLEALIGCPLADGVDIGAGIGPDIVVTACKDAESQVSCLMDLAMDPNVLVRSWQGLATWT